MDTQTPNPHELLDQVNRFEQLTQAEQARDLFAEMSQLLEHDGKDLMADFVMYVSECYDDINGQDHRNLDDYTRATSATSGGNTTTSSQRRKNPSAPRAAH